MARSKACVRFRRGKWVVDYRDAARKRHWLSYPGTPEGEQRASAEAGRINKDAEMEDDQLDRNVTVEGYIEYWLTVAEARVSEQTSESYRSQLQHLAPLYPVKVRDLTRRQMVRFFAALKKSGDLAETSVAQLLSVVRNMLSEAVEEDDLLPANPASGVRKKLGLRAHDNASIKAMDGDQFEAFLAAARAELGPPDHLALAIYTYAGLRMGEGLGLQVGDVKLEVPRRLSVERQIIELTGKVALPKGGKKRLVDLSDDLAELLREGLVWRREYLLRTAIRSDWLLYPDLEDTARNAGRFRVSRRLAKVLDAARLPGHFTPHCLRHTYATLLLQRGEDLLYVSRQLGHASVSITADRYGKWLVMPSRSGGPNLLSGKKPLAHMLSKA